MPTPVLNWKEIEKLAAGFANKLEGLFVDRIVVPGRDEFPAGYLKGEWAIRLTGKRSEGTLLFSIRPRHPYFVFSEGKGPRAAPQGTRSPFDLEISKHLKGQRLLGMEVVPRERTVIFWFAAAAGGELGLALSLIPAAPEAFLVRGPRSAAALPILTRSKTEKNNARVDPTFSRPDGSQAPADPVVREELVSNPTRFARVVERELEAEAFEIRKTASLREIRDRAKQCRDRIRQSETAIREAEADRDWQRFGDLLKASMHLRPAMESATGKDKWQYRVRDYAADETVSLPADPQLDLSRQVEKYYSLARRKSRRISEARSRADSVKETLIGLDLLLANPPEPGDWKSLKLFEQKAGISIGGGTAPAGKPRKGAWLGKTFLSKDGLTIFVGRSKDENLELTFKHARGNDIWMHVRGKPGAHTVVPLQPGKSAPLETLLDAAALTLYYSGGENWGTTEVDYTFKKHVKRIKDSTEASYTNNKTLLVQPDQARIKRLLSQ